MKKMTADQIATAKFVKGIKAGLFMVLGSRMVGEEFGYQLKLISVDPDGGLWMNRGELFLPADCVIA